METGAENVMNRHATRLMEIENVNGVEVEQYEDGREYIKVFVSKLTPEIKGKIPRELEGYTIEVEEVGDFYSQ